LTLVVIAVTVTRADRVSRSGRVWARALPGSLALLTLAVVASALSRMWSYQQAYGFTVLRLGVEACELWLGVVYLLVIAAGVRLRLGWLPRAMLATGLAGLLGLAVADPERLIAQQNVLRWQHTGIVDLRYLGNLSDDVIPGLSGLDPLGRQCVLMAILRTRHDRDPDAWNEWNASRAAAPRRPAAALGC
jgi:hypothetical protein